MRCPNVTLATVLANQVAVRASMLSTNGVVDWTVENTEHLDKLTTIRAARTLFRTTMHLRHVVVVVKTVSLSLIHI